ncbi:hypothetical protein N7G274_006855 [Stereocaulon virgatum]|uniref:CUE domain-containing protein n=1 Tax=Stereocaulon virgatum TaxID=373712 RepID=A0ABR4A7P5_9LECA
MAVPKMSQLRLGIGVNIVLKADQRSGKLTTGQILQILTRGNHPRGIKVRLSNGLVGRVQSLSAPSEQQAATQSTTHSQNSSNKFCGQTSHARGRPDRKYALKEDHRNSPTPHESASLADYIRAPSSSQLRHPSSRDIPVKDTTQATMEKDFPHLDSALIAAVLADHEGAEEARAVLSSLS